MRRTYLSSDFTISPIEGTYNMQERKTPFSSKMMDIEDILNIFNNEVIYYQQSTGEQLNLANELLLTPITYSPNLSKLANHTLAIDINQSDYDKDNLTKWVLNINVREIIIEFIFANIKKARAFELVKNDKTFYNSVDLAIKQYIDQNLYKRYKLQDIKLYVSYNSVKNLSNLRYKNNWNSNVANDLNQNKKIGIDYSSGKKTAAISFRQDETSKEFSFDYYFDIIMVRS